MDSQCAWEAGCYRCNGGGWIVFCIDDLCRGAGYCMHGDGERPCPNCNPDGTHQPVPPSAGKL